MKRFKFLFGSLVLLVSAAMPVAASAAPNTTLNNVQKHHDGFCTDVPVPVALGSGQPHKQYVAGTFCYPYGKASSVDVLIHGATYDRTYWDSGYNFPQYSYVNRTLQAGRAVFYYDRLGVGKSSQLKSTDVTMDADAYVVHQLVQLFKPVFHNVNIIGHSYGSRIAQLESSQFNDATKVVLTDSLHAVGPALANNEITQYPANQDPKFAGLGLDDGWTTTTPGNARKAFYNLATADPNEIAYDDAHKAILSNTQFTQGQIQGRVPAGSNLTNSITRPVLLIYGQQDRLYCGLALDCSNTAAVLANEQPYYTSVASLTAKVVPDTGHDMALHPSAGTSFTMINDWLK